MKFNKSLFISIVYILLGSSLFAQPKIIFDTDFGMDADDLGALVMLHNLIEKQECELIGIMLWSTEEYAVSAVDAVNRYYHHPDIPIGTRQDSTYFEAWNYSKSIADNFPHKLNYENVPDAIGLYRELLVNNPDKSVSIVTVGPLKNIENLLKSKPDSISPLSGKELIQQKVKEFVIMGGQYPSGTKEWNFDGNMPGVTKYVVNNIDAPIIFSGYELGLDIRTGEVFNNLDSDTPLYIGFMHFSQNAPWMKDAYQGNILDNSTYDQTAVLYAVRNGVGIYWEEVRGTNVPDAIGGNTWVNTENSNQAYLKRIVPNEYLENLIESLMLNEFK